MTMMPIPPEAHALLADLHADAPWAEARADPLAQASLPLLLATFTLAAQGVHPRDQPGNGPALRRTEVIAELSDADERFRATFLPPRHPDPALICQALAGAIHDHLQAHRLALYDLVDWRADGRLDLPTWRALLDHLQPSEAAWRGAFTRALHGAKKRPQHAAHLAEGAPAGWVEEWFHEALGHHFPAAPASLLGGLAGRWPEGMISDQDSLWADVGQTGDLACLAVLLANADPLPSWLAVTRAARQAVAHGHVAFVVAMLPAMAPAAGRMRACMEQQLGDDPGAIDGFVHLCEGLDMDLAAISATLLAAPPGWAMLQDLFDQAGAAQFPQLTGRVRAAERQAALAQATVPRASRPRHRS